MKRKSSGTWSCDTCKERRGSTRREKVMYLKSGVCNRMTYQCDGCGHTFTITVIGYFDDNLCELEITNV